MDLISEPQASDFPTNRVKRRTIADRLSERAKRTFVGRQNELSTLTNAIESSDLPFMVAFVHGPGGIGKSRLLHATIDRISPEINRYVMDCRQVEPTPQGFLIALGAALEVQESEPDFATELQQRDPDRFRQLRRRAYSYFTKQSHRAVANTLWQHTADLLYMIENPIARDAFFPEGASDYRVEPATANDANDIRKIVESKEPGV